MAVPVRKEFDKKAIARSLAELKNSKIDKEKSKLTAIKAADKMQRKPE